MEQIPAYLGLALINNQDTFTHQTIVICTCWRTIVPSAQGLHLVHPEHQGQGGRR